MARLNSVGNSNAIAHVDGVALGGLYRYAPEDADAHIETMPATGLRFVLPGPDAHPPNALPNPAPNDGDYYEWHDPLGLLATGNVIVDGGGYPIAASSLGNPATVTFGVGFAFDGMRFTFNGNLQMWVGCGCSPFFSRPD